VEPEGWAVVSVEAAIWKLSGKSALEQWKCVENCFDPPVTLVQLVCWVLAAGHRAGAVAVQRVESHSRQDFNTVTPATAVTAAA
jgi:hypothetical protein